MYESRCKPCRSRSPSPSTGHAADGHGVDAQRGLADAYDTIYIDHVSGGVSRLMLKSFDQSVDAFKGTNEDLIWLDEEPPQEVKTECTIRTMTTGGILIVTLTPINGLTSMIDEYLKTCSNRDELPIAA